MDQNKIAKLEEINYKVARVCGTCVHFKQYEDMHFGECDANVYVHLKHSGGKRLLSVVQYGTCDQWTEATDLEYLHGFREFLK